MALASLGFIFVVKIFLKNIILLHIKYIRRAIPYVYLHNISTSYWQPICASNKQSSLFGNTNGPPGSVIVPGGEGEGGTSGIVLFN